MLIIFLQAIKKAYIFMQAFDLFGASEGIRTPDRLITNQLASKTYKNIITNNNK